MLNRVLMGVMMVLAACRSSEKQVYETIAREVDPALGKMWVPISWALNFKNDHDPDLLRAEIYACHYADQWLEQLRRVDLSKTGMKEDFSWGGTRLLDERYAHCRSNDVDRLERCVANCIEGFRQIARVGIELHRRAEAHGVYIEGLESAIGAGVDLEERGPTVTPE